MNLVFLFRNVLVIQPLLFLNFMSTYLMFLSAIINGIVFKSLLFIASIKDTTDFYMLSLFSAALLNTPKLLNI